MVPVGEDAIVTREPTRPTKARTKVLLASHHRILRQGVRAMFEKEPGSEVVAEAADGRTAVSVARAVLPDVAIMDVAMPELNGIEATRQIVGELPDVKILEIGRASCRERV